MPPKKKSQKMALTDFLGDSGTGSWADEMDALPSAPAPRTDEERARGNDRFGRRDDFLSTRPDRSFGPPREDLPLPTVPPFTAFIGNLSFDLTEHELEGYFSPIKTTSVKIIKDRDDKPKGFGYIEFAELDGLKAALEKSGTNFSGRTIRVSVAEPPKERPGFGGPADDDSKFDNPWRRDGPLPDRGSSREPSRRRFDGPSGAEAPPGPSESASHWRSSQPARRLAPEPDAPQIRRRGSGFAAEGQVGAADKEDTWTKGSKFKPAEPPTEDSGSGSKFGSIRGRGEMGPPKDASAADESDWRSSSRPRPVARNSTSPSTSTPPTPQMGRRKLELLPRSGAPSASPSPLSSPKMAPAVAATSSRANPFGAARPVDVTIREKEVTERLEKEKEFRGPSHPMSRTSSRTAVQRAHTPPTHASTPPTPTSPTKPAPAANVRPSISFANAASAKKEPEAGHTKENADAGDNAPPVVAESEVEA